MIHLWLVFDVLFMAFCLNRVYYDKSTFYRVGSGVLFVIYIYVLWSDFHKIPHG